jgi:hypothetical protein
MPALKVWVANERLTSTDLNATFASVQQPDGVVASAPANTVQTTPIPLTTVVEGKAAYLSGGRIVTPRAGLYLVSGLITVTNGVGTVSNTHHVTIVNTALDFDVMSPQASFKVNFALPLVLASGVQITASYTVVGGSPSCTIHRLGFLFLGTGYAP